MIRSYRIFLFLLLLLPLALQPQTAMSWAQPDKHEQNREKLLSFLIRQQLAANHYSHKELDDSLSRSAFELYLQQLDPQKRFLLQKDAEKLRPYADRIDDELRLGRLELAKLSSEILKTRVSEVRKMVQNLLEAGFDFERKETLETDSEKISFASNETQLRERWRKTLKLQVINRYLNLLEDEQSKPEEEQREPAELRRLAGEKIAKSTESLFERMLEDTEQDYADRYFDTISRAFDPHTNYMPPTSKEDFDISMRGSLEGIGATLREEDGYIKVVRIIPGSAAWRQGKLEAEDIILAVGEGNDEDVDITDTRLRDAVSLIRGPKGSEVRLTVRKPDGTRQVIPIERDVVQIEETFVKWGVLPGSETQGPLGYIKIPSFYRDFQGSGHGGTARNSTDDVRAALEELKKNPIKGLILDLRNNGGGALTDAVSIAGLFIEEGPVVQVKNSLGKLETLHDEDSSIAYAGPMVVLVNKFSASASEILAGALQDYRRAVIIGSEHTHGKGTVQAIIDLDRTIPFPNMERYQPLGAMKVTIQKFYRVSGESTQYRGIEPDIVLPDRLKHLESGEQYLDYSLPWDTVPATDYERWEHAPQISLLRERSRARIAEDEDFQMIAQAAEASGKRMNKTLISLAIDDLQHEREEAEKLREEGSESFHGGEIPPAERGKSQSPAEKRQIFVEAAAKDPYIAEARAILSDLRATSSQTGPDGLTAGDPQNRSPR